MRVEKSVTSITWIPSEAISGMPRLPFEMGVAHYDAPPPDKLDDLEELRQADAFREGSELFLLLDGVVDVEVSGEPVAEIGPGALLGERALLEGGRRTATIWAKTPVRVAVVPPDAIEESALPELAAS